ncbi:zinc finger protein [Trichonephila clavipes]|nr:zinc finger protein [Trichonephila clavipes]
MRISHKRLTIWKTTFAVLLPIYGHKGLKKSSKIGRPDWTTSEPAAAPLLLTSVSVRSIARHLDEDQLVSRLLRVLLLIPTPRHLHLEQHRAQKDWTAAEWKVVFCEESRFSLDSD